MSLTTNEIEHLAPKDRPYKASDGGGMFLLVIPTGSKWWRMKYRFGGKEKQVSLGVYPAVSLDMARLKRSMLRALLADGIDPGEHVKMERESQRAEKARQTEAMRFALDNDGSLTFKLGPRRLSLTATETADLRTFLDATRAVIPKVTRCL